LAERREVVRAAPLEGRARDVEALGRALVAAADPGRAEQRSAAEVLAQVQRLGAAQVAVDPAQEAHVLGRRLHRELVEGVLVRRARREARALARSCASLLRHRGRRILLARARAGNERARERREATSRARRESDRMSYLAARETWRSSWK